MSLRPSGQKQIFATVVHWLSLISPVSFMEKRYDWAEVSYGDFLEGDELTFRVVAHITEARRGRNIQCSSPLAYNFLFRCLARRNSTHIYLPPLTLGSAGTRTLIFSSQNDCAVASVEHRCETSGADMARTLRQRGERDFAYNTGTECHFVVE